MAELEYYGGAGYCKDTRIKGEFVVRTNGIDRKFTNLGDAAEYYESLQESKFLWDMTVIPELLEGHTLKE